jgi:iron complex transport system substrate-binding protein
VDVEAAISVWLRRPVPIVSLSPRSLADAYGDIGKIAQALGVPNQGGALVRRMRDRMAAVESRVAHKPKPSVAFLVWVEPLMVAGDWMPALVEAAGGRNLFDKADTNSMQWDEIRFANPDVIIVALFGYDLARCLEERSRLEARPGWSDLTAVRSRRLYFVDGNAYFNRLGPRLADSTEILAEMLHPDISGHRHEGSAWVRYGEWAG